MTIMLRSESVTGYRFGSFITTEKQMATTKKPKELADVYGNQYISADVSSAINLWKNENGTLELFFNQDSSITGAARFFRLSVTSILCTT